MLQGRVQAVGQRGGIEPGVKRFSRIVQQRPQQAERSEIAVPAIGPQAFHQALTLFHPAHQISKANFICLFLQANAASGATLILHIPAQGQALKHLQ